MTRRGQAFTVEAVTAALLLLGTVAFIIQMPGITPLTESTANQQVPSQQRGVAAGVLDTAVQQDLLRDTLLYWDNESETFHGTVEEDNYYVDAGPPTAFGALLNETFEDHNTGFNVDLTYLNASDEPTRIPLVRQGTPPSTAVSVSRTVTLYDDDILLNASSNPTGRALEDTSDFYAPDAAPGSPVYNVIRVEVTVWSV